MEEEGIKISKKTVNSFIAEVPEEVRPRERFVRYGEQSLSDQELLAIVLRTGAKGKNVTLLALHILNHFGSLYNLRTASLQEIQHIKEIGLVKAIEIKAVMEIGARINKAHQPKYGTVSSSQAIGNQLIIEMSGLQQEHLMVMYLDTKNKVIKKENLFIGSLNQSIAHPREIFKGAVKNAAAKIVLAHNHPSGNPTPSHSDIQFTKRIKNCGELMGIELLDHLIIGQKTYYSLKEQGEF